MADDHNQSVSLPTSEHIRNVALDIILTLLTCGLFNLYVQYRQIVAVNAMLRQEKYNFVSWLLLTVITCGLYHIYHEYRKSEDINRALGRDSSSSPLVIVVLSIFGLHIIGDAIQQSEINKFFGSSAL